MADNRQETGRTEIDTVVGTTLGSYRIDARVGEGAMGRVYRGTHIELGRPVAIKTLHPEISRDESLIERFFNEARAVNVIRHENIVECTDLVRDPDGRSYMVMEFLDGRSLGNLMTSEGKLAPQRACRIARQMALALAAAHDKGIIHRDLKPDNVFLVKRESEPDFVKVLDFGIARLRPEGDAVRLTQTGQSIGTPAYMAPEQVTGQQVTPASDVYALGVVVYEMLCGEIPFSNATTAAMVMLNKLSESSPSINTRIKVPPRLANLVDRMVAQDPADRPPTMTDVADELLAVMNLPVQAPTAGGGQEAANPYDETADPFEETRPPPDGRDAVPSSPRPRSKLPLILGAVMVAASAAVVIVLTSRQADPPPPPSTTAPTPHATAAEEPKRTTAPESQDAMNGWYRARGLPPAPKECRHPRDRLEPLARAAALLVPLATPREAAQARATLIAEPETSAEKTLLLAEAELASASDPESAIAMAARAVTECAELAAAHGVLGRALAAGQRFEGASRALRDALKMAPDYHLARFNLGIAELGRKRNRAALEALLPLREHATEFPNLELILGEVYLSLGESENAVEAFEVAARRSLHHGRALRGLGQALQSTGRTDEAKKAYCQGKDAGDSESTARCDQLSSQ